MTEPTSPYPIRTASPETLRSFLAPAMVAFAEELTDSDFEEMLHTAEPDRFIAAFDGEAAIGTAGIYTFRLTVPGGEVDAAGVTAVGVEPGHRRAGVLTSLMRRQLDDVRERGEPVAVLWASEGAIYQRFGYGLGTVDAAFEVDRVRTSWLRPAQPGGRMRLVDEAEALAEFPPVYEAVRRTTPGSLSRSEAWWRWRLLPDPEKYRQGGGPKFRYLYEVDGSAEGYAMYRVTDSWDDRGPRGQLIVVEVMAATTRARRAIWSFLFGVDLVRTIRARRQPFPHPLFLELAEPRALGMTSRDGLWLRLVDLPVALAARRYGAADALVLEVADGFCPWNAGRWSLDATGKTGDAPHVARTDAPADLALDVADLAAVYLGAIRMSDLVQASRVTEVTPGAARRADVLFASDRPPYCGTMF